MSQEPDLSRLHEALTLLETSDGSLTQILTQTQPILLPGAQRVRVYRLAGRTAVLHAATAPGADLDLDDGAHAAHAAAIALGEPVYSAASALWAVPLLHDRMPFALVEIGTPDASDDTRASIRLAVRLLHPSIEHSLSANSALGVRSNDDALSLVQAQYEASGTIYGSENPVEILRALNNFTGGVFAHVRLALRDAQLAGYELRVVAESDSNGTRAGDAVLDLREYPAYEALVALEALSVTDTHADAFLTDPEKAWLEQQAIRSLVMVPLVVAQELTGALIFTHTVPTLLSAARLRALRNLADQMAIVFQNRTLLRSTQDTADQLRQQIEILEALNRLTSLGVSAPDEQAIMDAALREIAQALRADHAGLVMLDRAHDHGRVVSEYPNTGTVGMIVPIEAFEALADRLLQQPYYTRTEHAEPEASRAHYAQLGIHSIAIFPMRVQNILVGTVGLDLYTDERTFTPDEIEIGQTMVAQLSLSLQNLRLLNETQQRAQELGRQVARLELLNRMALVTTSMLSEGDLIRVVLRAITEAMNADHTALVLFNVENMTATLMQEHPSADVATEFPTFPLDDNDVRLAQNNEPVVLHDTDVPEAGASRAMYQELGITSIAIFPLRLGGERLGTIGVDLYTREKRFTPEDIELGQTLTAQLSLALQNLSLISEAQRRAEQLQRISNFTQSLMTSLEMDAVLQTAIREIAQALPLYRLSLALYDARTHTLQTAGTYRNGQISIPANTPIDEYTLQVWQTQAFIHIADTGWVSTDEGQAARSIMVAPIRALSGVRGVVRVDSQRAHAFSDTDIAIFQQMMSQLGIAIENVQTYEQTQRQAKAEALVNDISAQLQQQQDIGQMLDVTMTELGRALGARRARIRLNVRPTDES